MVVDKKTITASILERVEESPIWLDDLVEPCPECTWNQIFIEVDRLSRQGAIQLRREGVGHYILLREARAADIAAS